MMAVEFHTCEIGYEGRERAVFARRPDCRHAGQPSASALSWGETHFEEQISEVAKRMDAALADVENAAGTVTAEAG